MKHPILSLLFLFLLALAAGCASAPARFYTLNVTAQDQAPIAAPYAVAVGPVSIPATVDRPQFTVRMGPNRVVIDEFNRWAEPLGEGIARVIAGDLAVLLGTPQVASTLETFHPDYRVTVGIERFESGPGRSVLIEAVWRIGRQGGAAPLSGRTLAMEPAPGAGFEGLAAAHSAALLKVSRDIAAAIRAGAATP